MFQNFEESAVWIQAACTRRGMTAQSAGEYGDEMVAEFRKRAPAGMMAQATVAMAEGLRDSMRRERDDDDDGPDDDSDEDTSITDPMESAFARVPPIIPSPGG